MGFAPTDRSRAINQDVRRVTPRFGDGYRLVRDRDGAFAHEHRRAGADGCRLRIAMPVEYGGSDVERLPPPPGPG